VNGQQHPGQVSGPVEGRRVGRDPDPPDPGTAALLLLSAMGRVVRHGSEVVLLEVHAARQASGRIVKLLAGATLLLITAWFILNAAAIWIGIAHLEIHATVMLLAVGGVNLVLALVMALVALRQWRVVSNTPRRAARKVLGR
jgi:hypothetical protein